MHVADSVHVADSETIKVMGFRLATDCGLCTCNGPRMLSPGENLFPYFYLTPDTVQTTLDKPLVKPV